MDPITEYHRNQLLAQQAMIQRQLNQMNQMPPQFNPHPQPQQQQFVTRQIGDVKEAASFMVDPGTMYLFLDTSTGRIYLKYFNPDNGKSEFFTYAVVEEAQEAREDPMEQINIRLSNIERMIGGQHEPVQNDTGGAKSYGNGAGANAGKNEKSKPANVQRGAENDSGEK